MMKHIPADRLALGNVSPSREFLNGTPDSIRKATTGLLEKCSKYPNFVISSGCDIPPQTGFDNIDAFFDAVKTFYA